MKQNIFETRQRANELMQEALNIWKASDQSDFLDGLEKDPVFNVIMSALAYQANDFDNEVAQLKSDICDEFERLLSVGAAGSAIPASVVLQTNAKGSHPVAVGESSIFSCPDFNTSFLPLLRTVVYNILDVEVSRIDGRRWKVGLTFPEPIDSIAGMSFAISELPYHTLTVSLMNEDGTSQPLKITESNEPANIPTTEYFSVDTLLYNRTHAVVGGGSNGNLSQFYRNCALDVFTQQRLNMYVIKQSQNNAKLPSPSTHVDLCFEFDGLGSDFLFDKNQVAFNALILVNVSLQTVTLSKSSPIARLAGSDTEDFLYLLRPNSDQIMAAMPLCVRNISSDRFNRSNLVMLLGNLINRFQTDYYAFIDTDSGAEHQLERVLDGMKKIEKMAQDKGKVTKGVYLMFDSHANLTGIENVSLGIRYLTTRGAELNDKLTQKTKILSSGLLDDTKSVQIVAPTLGTNAIRDEQSEKSMLRYLMTTNDRLVTPADLKLFCYNELLTRYSIIREMVKEITVKHERFDQGSYHTYCIKVHITLASNNFVKRAFTGKVESVERYLEKMMQVRSANIYPIKVKMKI